MNISWEGNVKCPYYINQSVNRLGTTVVNCEGMTDEISVSCSKFNSYEDFEWHRKKYCYKYPNDCPLAEIISRKYEEKEDGYK